MPKTPKIAISSLNADSGAATPHIAAALAAQYGAPNVSLLEMLPHPALRAAALGQAEVVIVIMGPQWLSVMAGTPASYLARGELEQLLSGPQTRLILPLLVQGAVMPAATLLPPGLQPLAYVNALVVQPGAGFADDMRLVTATITNHFKQALAARQAAGNYLWFKVLSVLPLLFFFSFLALPALFGGKVSQFTRPELIFSLFLDVALIVSFFGMWGAGIIITLVTRQFRWAVTNGAAGLLSIEGIVLFLVLNSTLQANQTATAIVAMVIAIGILSVLCAFLWPIIFGFVLPPHPFRQRSHAKFD